MREMAESTGGNAPSLKCCIAFRVVLTAGPHGPGGEEEGNRDYFFSSRLSGSTRNKIRALCVGSVVAVFGFGLLQLTQKEEAR